MQKRGVEEERKIPSSTTRDGMEGHPLQGGVRGESSEGVLEKGQQTVREKG